MERTNWILLGLVVLLAMGLILPTGCGQKEKESEEEAVTQEMEEPEEAAPSMELPAPVMAAIEANMPGAEVDKVEMAEQQGITLYDIEFTGDMGEMEVADDGTVMDVVTIITMEDLPEAAAAAIEKAAGGMTISRLEKSEIRSEIKTEGEEATIAKLEAPRYEYEAEVASDVGTAEITVDADGNIIEPLKTEME